MTKRSIFLPNESYEDVQSALAKADTDEEYKHLVSERLKANGWTKEKEIRFREHCEIVGFILGGKKPKANPLDKNSYGRTSARVLADATRNDLRQSAILSTDKVE